MPATIVYVHRNGNKVRKDLSKAQWDEALFGEDVGDRSRIAYDVLREARYAGREMPLLLTVDSPLGPTQVQDLITRALDVPAGVRAWRNVCDARDLVALDNTLRPQFAPPEQCTDFVVTDHSANHHGIREYLRTVPVRQSVLDMVGA